MTALADPAYLPFKLDLVTRRVLMLRLDARQRRAAAFLDERAIPASAEGGWVPLDALLEHRGAAGPAAHALFHIGHCGSTLLSRVLESWPGQQGLREPLPLRTLAEAWPHLAAPESRLAPADAASLLQALWSLWSRPLEGVAGTVVKATSSCNALMEPLLQARPAMRVILLDMPLQAYLATLLKAPDSVRDAASAAAGRLHDLRARGLGDGVFLHALALPEQCAMGWLAERVRFAALARDYGTQVLRVDFERLLGQPEPTLRAVASHLALDPGGIAIALASPAWQRYSKAPDHAYGAGDRAHDLALALQRHGEAIDQGVAWVDAQLARHPGLADVI